MKELEDLAASVRAQLNLQYDGPSVKFIEGFIERNKVGFNPAETEGLIHSLGCFLGQCIIHNYGGQWQIDKEINSLAVAFDPANKVYPIAKVRKQFENGIQDSVFSFYSTIPVIFMLEKKKKPWWKI